VEAVSQAVTDDGQGKKTLDALRFGGRIRKNSATSAFVCASNKPKTAQTNR
jgi:hypothetical protein